MAFAAGDFRGKSVSAASETALKKYYAATNKQNRTNGR